MKYFLHLGYDGTNYCGWQYQPNTKTVQGTIEEKLELIFKENITIFGCGRTDAGVHSSQYIAHIIIDKPFDFDLKFRLNKHLPKDISIFEVIEMEDHFDARYDPISRTYDYFIHLYKDPTLNRFSSYYDIEKLDFEAMQKAASIISNYTNFKSICKQPAIYKHHECRVSNSKLFVDPTQERMQFTITANRFLRGMVRLLVSFILKVGEGKITIEQFEALLSNKLELEEKDPALPNGLFLSHIEYSYLNLKRTTRISDLLKIN